MTTKKSYVRILTVCLFATLIIGFVAYSSGAFKQRECHLPQVVRDSAGITKTDTAKIIQAAALDSSFEPKYDHMSSSKVLILAQPKTPKIKTPAVKDTQAATPQKQQDSVEVPVPRMMSSSKSTIVLDPQL